MAVLIYRILMVDTTITLSCLSLSRVARNFQKHMTLFATAEAVSFPFKRLEKCRGACASYTIEYLYSAAARRNFTETTPRCSAMLVVQVSL